MEFTYIDLYVAILIIVGCGCAIALRSMLKGAAVCGCSQCFECNKGTCVGCSLWDPMISAVQSAYVQRYENNKVVATCTLTFKDDFVVAQSPAGGEEKWQIPSFVGCYKTTIMKWADRATTTEPRFVSFS